MRPQERAGDGWILLSGPTGLLGAALLAELLGRGRRVLALARRSGTLSAAERIRRLLISLGCPTAGGRLEVLDLDDGSAARLLGRHGGEIAAAVHARAAVKFTSSREELHRQNVAATAEFLSLLDGAAPDADFHFVSTAYVCGDRLGVSREDQGSAGQSFRNPYEESKLLAEDLVRERCLASRRPFSIYRPSIIAGSSRDGRAANFNGIFSLLHLLDTLAGRRSPCACPTRVFIPCDAGAGKNIVPVDWTARAMAELISLGARGRTYHLTHPEPILHRDLLEVLRELFDWSELDIAASEGVLDPENPLQAMLLRGLKSVLPYLHGEPVFDRGAIERDLGPLARPPAVDGEYFSKLLEFGRSVRWAGRPLEGTPPVPAPANAA